MVRDSTKYRRGSNQIVEPTRVYQDSCRPPMPSDDDLIPPAPTQPFEDLGEARSRDARRDRSGSLVQHDDLPFEIRIELDLFAMHMEGSHDHRLMEPPRRPGVKDEPNRTDEPNERVRPSEPNEQRRP